MPYPVGSIEFAAMTQELQPLELTSAEDGIDHGIPGYTWNLL